MSWQTIQWPFPLDAQPAALVMGIGRHGEIPRERYTLGEIWCLHLYRYHGWVQVRGHEFPIRPRYASITPPQIELEHQFDDPVCVHAVVHFSLPPLPRSSHAILAMQDLGANFDRLNMAFEEAVGFFAANPRRAEVRLWDILWELVGSSRPADPLARLHPAVQTTLQTIELHLGEPLTIAELAGAVNLSHSHLTRLFRAEVGQTVIGCL